MYKGNKGRDVPNKNDGFHKVRLAVLDASDSSRRFSLGREEVEQIRCSKGCTGCCKRFIKISILEAIVILQSLNEKDRKTVCEKSRKLSGVSGCSNQVSWFKMNIPCPILSEDGLCMAYEVRPATCSTHFAASDPETCDPWSGTTEKYLPINDIDTFQKFRTKISNMPEWNSVMGMVWPLPSSIIAAEIILETKFDNWQKVANFMEKR